MKVLPCVIINMILILYSFLLFVHLQYRIGIRHLRVVVDALSALGLRDADSLREQLDSIIRVTVAEEGLANHDGLLDQGSVSEAGPSHNRDLSWTEISKGHKEFSIWGGKAVPVYRLGPTNESTWYSRFQENGNYQIIMSDRKKGVAEIVRVRNLTIPSDHGDL